MSFRFWQFIKALPILLRRRLRLEELVVEEHHHHESLHCHLVERLTATRHTVHRLIVVVHVVGCAEIEASVVRAAANA